MNFVSRLRRLLAPKPPVRRGEPGERAYAVGDVHGRLDLLEQMLATIEADVAARPRKKTYAVFLGDLVDRGPDSAGVVERLRTWRPAGIRPVFLAGNHEEMFLRILGGDDGLARRWLEFGGAECVASYGLDPERLKLLQPGMAIEAIHAAVPDEHVAFIEGFGDSFRFGDYLMVHAGIRPGVPLDQQKRLDLRWIREPFLSDATEHECVVVHGHTIVDEVDERSNRIGIDTGAYRSGMLTAIAIEEDARRYLIASHEGDDASLARSGEPVPLA